MRNTLAALLALTAAGCSTVPDGEPRNCAALQETLLQQIGERDAADAIASKDATIQSVKLLAEAATEAAATAGEMSEAGCSCKPATSCFDMLDGPANGP